MSMVGGLTKIAVVGGAVGAGIAAVATRNSDSGDGARNAAVGIGIGAGVTGGLGALGWRSVSQAFKSGDAVNTVVAGVLLGGPSMALLATGAGLGGAALGAALVAHARD